MRDPHVSALVYTLETDETVVFENPPPLGGEEDKFRWRVADGALRVELKEHHASEQSAQDRVEPFIRAWELWETLRSSRRRIWFDFEKAEIVDRDPPPPGEPQIIEVGPIERAFRVIAPTISTPHLLYPSPPGRFMVSPDVETMWNRYEGYRAGREPLASMAYLCFTVLRASAGGNKETAKQYGIDLPVLKKLVSLTTEIGDPQTARKVPKGGFRRPHTEIEKKWIESVVRALIRRVGEWAADPDANRPKLTMTDFPPLPKRI